MSASTKNVAPGAFRMGQLDPSTLRDSSLVGLVAPKGCGKSTLLKHLVYIKQHIPSGVCFSGTGKSNREYVGILPEMNCYAGANMAKLEEIYRYQETKTVKYERKFSKAQKREFRRQGIKIKELPLRQRFVKDPTIILILEDLLADKKLWNHPIISELAMNGRHQNIFALITIQYFKAMPKKLRGNFDYWFVFKQDDISVRKDIYNEFCRSYFKTFELFEEVFRAATTEHRVFFIDYRYSGKELKEKFKWWRADPFIPDFRLGCSRYWKFAKYNFRKPDLSNQAIVNKYRSRMSADIDHLTKSEKLELEARLAAEVEQAYSAKKGGRKSAVENPLLAAAKPARVVLCDNEGNDVSEQSESRKRKRPSAAASSVKRRRTNDRSKMNVTDGTECPLDEAYFLQVDDEEDIEGDTL